MKLLLPTLLLISSFAVAQSTASSKSAHRKYTIQSSKRSSVIDFRSYASLHQNCGDTDVITTAGLLDRSAKFKKRELETVCAAERQLKKTLGQQGFTPREIDELTGMTWGRITREALKPSCNSCAAKYHMDESSFISVAMTDFAPLTVESSPDGALVFLDGKKWGKKTKTRSFASLGSHAVRLTRDGYEEANKSIEVKTTENLLKINLSKKRVS